MLLMYAIIVYNEYTEYVDIIVWEPNSENCLNLISVAPPCEKVIFVCDESYITSTIRKFMLNMPSHGSSQNIGLKI